MNVYDRYLPHLLYHIYIHLSCQYSRDDEDNYNNEYFPIDCFVDAEHAHCLR